MERILGTSKVTRRYQVTIPKRVRELMKIEENDIIVFIQKDNEIIIRKG